MDSKKKKPLAAKMNLSSVHVLKDSTAAGEADIMTDNDFIPSLIAVKPSRKLWKYEDCQGNKF